MEPIFDIITYTLDENGYPANTYATGFFIEGGYVVSSASTMLALTFTRQTPTSYYLPRVQQVIGIINSVAYQLYLIGMSPLLDVAVLIAPVISCKLLSWADPRCTPIDSPIHTVVNFDSRDARTRLVGPLINNAVTDSSNPLIPELVSVYIPFTPNMQGAPLIGEKGVIGVIGSGLSNDTITQGVTSNLIRQAVNDIVSSNNVTQVYDPLGNWVQWNIASLGATFSYVTQPSYPVQPNSKVTGATILTMDNSDLSNYFKEGDVLVSVNGYDIGYQSSSITTALIGVIPGQSVTVGAIVDGQLVYDNIVTRIMGTYDFPYPTIDEVNAEGGAASIASTTGGLLLSIAGAAISFISGHPFIGVAETLLAIFEAANLTTEIIELHNENGGSKEAIGEKANMLVGETVVIGASDAISRFGGDLATVFLGDRNFVLNVEQTQSWFKLSLVDGFSFIQLVQYGTYNFVVNVTAIGIGGFNHPNTVCLFYVLAASYTNGQFTNPRVVFGPFPGTKSNVLRFSIYVTEAPIGYLPSVSPSDYLVLSAQHADTLGRGNSSASIACKLEYAYILPPQPLPNLPGISP